MSLKKAAGLINKNKAFLITAHVNPEADALGAELAFLHLLRKLGKTGFIMNESRVPAECEFLPGVSNILPLSKKIKDFDCAVFLDCSENARAGGVAGLINPDKPTLNIDHHISNTRFASVNWVGLNASSTCEMVYRLYQRLRVQIDSDAALMLYAGIVVDTGSFRYNNTSAAVHRISASLIEKGISPARVYGALFENNPFLDIKLLGRIISAIKRDSSGRICWVDITHKALEKKFPVMDLSDMVLGLLRSIRGVELAMVFKQVRGKRNHIRINFRSQTNFDCNYLASRFGGGGHKNASGATVAGDLAKVKNKVIGRAKELMNPAPSKYSSRTFLLRRDAT